jgi:metal-responsive CopG/Arc/MetJ family transcriptional regulator
MATPPEVECTDEDGQVLNVRLPKQLVEAIELFRLASGRRRGEIVAGAIRTYLADPRQHDTVQAFLRSAFDARHDLGYHLRPHRE